MKLKFLYIAVFLFAMTACSQSELPAVSLLENNFYDQTHLYRLNLRGTVKEVREYLMDTSADSESVLSATYKFDSEGNIITYDPTGEGDKVQPYWLPVNAEVYQYEYDAHSRLSEVHIFSNGQATRVYKLQYGNHSNYMPLPFEFKPFEDWLIKGITTITCEESKFYYEFDGEKLVLEKDNNGWTEYDTVYFKHNYPVLRTSVIRDGDYEIQRTETQWLFQLPNGVPVRKTVTVSEDGHKYSFQTIYAINGLPLEKIVQDNSISQKNYTYNTMGWLWKMTVLSDNSETGSMDCIYDMDQNNNWIWCQQKVEGFIGWEYSEGTLIKTRTITY